MGKANSAHEKSCAPASAEGGAQARIRSVSSPFGFRLPLETELVDIAACLESELPCVGTGMVSIFGAASRDVLGAPVNRYVEAIPACVAD